MILLYLNRQKLIESFIVEKAIKNAAEIGRYNKNGNAAVFVDDIGTEIILSNRGLIHGLDRRFSVNAPVTLKAGKILKNSIRINELTPTKETVDSSYALIGTGRNTKGELYIARFVVNKYSNEFDSMDVLYAINAKKEPGALLPSVTGKPAPNTDSSTISISDLIHFVNEYFPDILPESVLKHYGHKSRPEGELGKSALFQRTLDTIEESDARALMEENEALRAQVKMLQAEFKLTRDFMGTRAIKHHLRELTKEYGAKSSGKLFDKLYDQVQYAYKMLSTSVGDERTVRSAQDVIFRIREE